MVVVDIETAAWFNMPEISNLPRSEQLKKFEVGVAVTGILTSNGWTTVAWRGDQIADLVETLIFHQPIAGWNIVDFDIPVIQNHHERMVGKTALAEVTTVDLFREIRAMTGRWYKLEEVAQATMGRGKTADGLQASEWLRAGNWHAAANYCTNDVLLEAELVTRAMGSGIILPKYHKREMVGDKRTLRLKSIEWTIE